MPVSRPVGTHQGPWVHIKAYGYTSRPVGTHQGPDVVEHALQAVARDSSIKDVTVEVPQMPKGEDGNGGVGWGVVHCYQEGVHTP